MVYKQTAVIWDECNGQLMWFLVDGDYSHLDGCYINDGDWSDADQDELSELAFDPRTAEFKHKRNEVLNDIPRDPSVAIIATGVFP